MLALGHKASDMFTDRLTTPAMIAIVNGCHPGTAIHAHLSAAEQERQEAPKQPETVSGFTLYSIAEFEAHRAKIFQKGA